MKKKFLLVFCLCFLLLPLSGNAGEGWKLDGYEWAEKPIIWKLGFTHGWVMAGLAMFSEMQFIHVPMGMNFISSKEYRTATEDERKKIERIIFKVSKIPQGVLKGKGFELSSLTVGQVIDTIDKIYSDSRVKTWEIFEIMPLVRGRLKEGWTEKDLDEVIAYKIKYYALTEKMKNYESRKVSESEEWKNQSGRNLEKKLDC